VAGIIGGASAIGFIVGPGIGLMYQVSPYLPFVFACVLLVLLFVYLWLSPTLRNGGVNADGSVATVPYEAIRAFLSRPGIITSEEIKASPYVLSIRDGHLVGGLNNDVYVKGPVRGVGERYNVMHIEQPLQGGNSHKKVGYMTVYAGGVQLARTGDPATAHVTEAVREVQIGDVLLANTPSDTAAIVPHVPTGEIQGKVVAVTDGVKLVGNYQVVALDSGSAQGVEVGHVLRAWSAPQTASDHCKRINGEYSCNRWKQARLPSESAGTSTAASSSSLASAVA